MQRAAARKKRQQFIAPDGASNNFGAAGRNETKKTTRCADVVGGRGAASVGDSATIWKPAPVA